MSSRQPAHRDVVAGGIAMFATAMMLLVGGIHVLQGVAVLVDDRPFRAHRSYLLSDHATTWGCVLVALGLLSIATALFMQSGRLWPRVSGVALAATSAAASFLWLPHYPAWATLIIIADLIVIWALCTFDDRYA